MILRSDADRGSEFMPDSNVMLYATEYDRARHTLSSHALFRDPIITSGKRHFLFCSPAALPAVQVTWTLASLQCLKFSNLLVKRGERDYLLSFRESKSENSIGLGPSNFVGRSRELCMGSPGGLGPLQCLKHLNKLVKIEGETDSQIEK